MKGHDANRHPGPWRVMRGDSEFAGLLVAVGFLVMGLVSMPIATWFVLGALALGVVVALLLRFTEKSGLGVVLATLLVLVAAVLWWAGLPPRRPNSVSSNALHVEPSNAPFRWHRTGYWLDCWFDEHANVDRCKLTDAQGATVFEDVFLPCIGQMPIPQRELVLDAKWTGSTWTGSRDKGVNVPVVELADRQVLLPQSFYAEAKLDAHCSAR
jgi:hypothetical protein